MGRVRRPMVPDGAIRAFFERLHALHSAAGHPSMRELQRRTRSDVRPHGINPTTIHDALSGPRLARWDTVQALVGQLGGSVEEFHTLWLQGRAAELDVPAQLERPRALTTVRPTPRSLPPDVPPFVGRIHQLAELRRLLEGTGRSTRIAAVSGTAGVGKTALAVHWAHRVAADFPDGHLYIDLRGYDPDSPMPPGEALAAVLRALGASSAEVPDDVAERAACYRSMIADREMLLVLDNARDTDHVRPLLPGTPSCFMVVTSRDRLAGLVARHGACRLNLDVLSPAEATELTRALLQPRIQADQPALEELAELCARLPLALRIAAELANSSTVTSLASLVRELADDSRRLDLFDAGDDPRTAIRAVFSWSYHRLPRDAARLFRLLGMYRGRDIDAVGIAALAKIGVDEAIRLADVLARNHMLERVSPVRYAMNRLLWTYAASLAA